MIRKIIKQGHNTLTVTLPSKWAQQLNLKAGDEIDLIEKGNSIILNGHENIKEKSTIIDISDFTVPLLWRFFQGAYRSGCSEIRVIFDPVKFYEDPFNYYTTQFAYAKLGEKVAKKTAIDMIQTIVNRFIGLGVIETGKNYCIIKEMGGLTEKEFDNSLRRIMLVIQHFFERTKELIENKDIGDVKICNEFHTNDLNIDRLVDYCCRILNKIHTSFQDDKKMLLFSTLFILELIGDEFKYIGKHIALTKNSVEDTLLFVELVREHFNMYYNLFYKFDKNLVINFGKNDFEINSKYDEMKYDYNIAKYGGVRYKLEDHSRSIAGHLMMISKFIFALGELRIEMEN